MCEMTNRVFRDRRVHIPWPLSDNEPDADGGVIWMSKAHLLKNCESAVPDPKRRLGVGKYWTVFASVHDDWSVVKVQLLVNEAQARRAVNEEYAYRLAEQYGVGPAVRSWFILRGSAQTVDNNPEHAEAGWLSPKTCKNRKIWGVAIAVVESFDASAADAGMKKDDLRYQNIISDLKKRVAGMEEKTGVVNTEPFQPRNVLISWKRPLCKEVENVVVGDWGSFKKIKI